MGKYLIWLLVVIILIGNAHTLESSPKYDKEICLRYLTSVGSSIQAEVFEVIPDNELLEWERNGYVPEYVIVGNKYCEIVEYHAKN